MRLRFHGLAELKLPLTEAFTTRPGAGVAHRHIWLLCYRDDQGRILAGECGPLTGVHQESYDQAGQQLKDWASGAGAQVELDESLMAKPEWDQPQFGLVAGAFYPSVQYALEQILWQSLFAESDRFGLPPIPDQHHFHLAGIISLADVTWSVKLKEFLDHGGRILKVKLGRQDFAKDLVQIQRLVHMAPQVTLRLDANQSLSSSQLQQLNDSLSSDVVEYIEEPLSDWSAVSLAGVAIPLAADESLWSCRPQQLTAMHPNLRRAVVKPARVGFSGLAAWSHYNGPERVVLSSCFESGLATTLLLQAAWFFRLQPALGLGTYPLLAGDWLTERLRLGVGLCCCSLRQPFVGMANALAAVDRQVLSWLRI
jgi:o-succinylbenzoate synthase